MTGISTDQRIFLARILVFARLARDHAGDIHFDRERFDRSLLHQNAIIRCIIAGGEAANKLRQTPEGEPENIDLGDLADMRHRLAHSHATDVNLDIVWNVATRRFPELISELEPLIEAEGTRIGAD